MNLRSGILGALIIFSSAHADTSIPACESMWVISPFTSCAVKENGVLYKLARTSACDAEKYKQCIVRKTITSNVVTETYNFRSDGISNYPLPADMTKKCQDDLNALYYSPEAHGSALDKYAKEAYLDPEEDRQTVYDLIMNGPQPKPDLVHARFHADPQDPLNYLLSCDHTATYHLEYAGRALQCGVEQYKECRDESHGIEGYVEKASHYCAASKTDVILVDKPYLTKIESRPDAIDVGTVSCLTQDDVPENSSSQIAAKLKTAIATYNAMANSMSALSSPLVEEDPIKLMDISHDLWRKSMAAELLEVVRLEDLSSNPDLAKYIDLAQEALIDVVYDMDKQIEWLGSIPDIKGLKAVQIINPIGFGNLRQSRRDSYLTLSTGEFVGLFYEDGIVLTAEEMKDARAYLASLVDSVKIYRFAEAAIRSAYANGDVIFMSELADTAQRRSGENRRDLLSGYQALYEGRISDAEKLIDQVKKEEADLLPETKMSIHLLEKAIAEENVTNAGIHL